MFQAKFLGLLHFLMADCYPPSMLLLPPPQLAILSSNQPSYAAKPQVTPPLETLFPSLVSDDAHEQYFAQKVQSEEPLAQENYDPLNVNGTLSVSLRLQDQANEPSAPAVLTSAVNFLLTEPGNHTLNEPSVLPIDSIPVSGTTSISTPLVMNGQNAVPSEFELPQYSLMDIGDPSGDLPPLQGMITISCETTAGQTLPDNQKQSPGWLSNVNWSADWRGGNGWNPTTTLTSTADPEAGYTPDYTIATVPGGIPGGDPDLRRFTVFVAAPDPIFPYDYSFKLTFGTKVDVYATNDKATAPIPSGTIFASDDLAWVMPGTAVKFKDFWLEGQTASTAFMDTSLKVDYVGAAGMMIPMAKKFDEVKVTVFGVTETGKFGGSQVEAENKQQPDDPKLHSMTIPKKSSFNENGQISWDLAKYINLKTTTGIDYCEFFHDCMEMQGTVSPPRDANPSVYYGTVTHAEDPSIPDAPPIFPPPPAGVVTFEQHRYAYIAAWFKPEGGEWAPKTLPTGYQPRVWTDDWTNFKSTQANIVTATSSGSHIYYIDSPGYDHKDHDGGLDYLVFYSNLRNAAFINFYGGTFQVSDWAKWHSKVDLIPKDSDTLTRSPNPGSQDFGSGWISIPTNIT